MKKNKLEILLMEKDIEIKNLKIQIKHLENDFYITRQENEEATEKYFDIYSNLENLVIQKTKELTKSQELYKILVEQANDGIIFSKTGKIDFYNKKFLELTGFKDEEIININFLELFDSTNREKNITLHKRRLEGIEIPKIYETNLIKKNGRKIPVELNNICVLYNNEDVVLTFIHDLTLRKLEEKRRIEIKKRESALATAVTASHEINQPLMILKGNVDMLSFNVKETEKTKKYFFRIDESIKRIQDILQKFKDADRVDFKAYSENTEMAVLNNTDEN